MALVSVTRRINGRAISAGAKDHTSHRLVMLGLSDRKAVITLYAIAAAIFLGFISRAGSAWPAFRRFKYGFAAAAVIAIGIAFVPAASSTALSFNRFDGGVSEDVDRLLDGAKIQLVNSDPPYNVDVQPRSNVAIAAGLSSFPAT